MKNTKKIISLILAICMIASLAISASAMELPSGNTVGESGGTGTSSVTLSSTADGSIGGDPAATKMSVTVPTVLPIRSRHGWHGQHRNGREDRQQFVRRCQGQLRQHRSRTGLVAGCVR